MADWKEHSLFITLFLRLVADATPRTLVLADLNSIGNRAVVKSLRADSSTHLVHRNDSVGDRLGLGN